MMASHVAPSDEQLIEQYYACLDDAFQALERRYNSRVISYFWARGIRPKEDCEECCQETWLRVARTKWAGARFEEGKSTFATWLFTIARNVAFDYWRRGSTRIPTVQPLQTPRGADDWDALGGVDPRLNEDLHDCIDRLPEPERTVINLRMEGYTRAEIAERLSTNQGRVNPYAVIRYEQLAHNQLRLWLEERGHAV